MSPITFTERTAARSKVRPVYIMFEEGITSDYMETVISAVNELLQIAGVSSIVPVTNFGVWRNPNHIKNGQYVKWNSVDWYIADARKVSRKGQLDCDRLVANLLIEPWQRQTPHYDLFVLKSDLYSHGTNFVLGLAQHHSVSVLSFYRLLELDYQLRHECLKTIVMHEMGHVFGLIPYERTKNVEEFLGKHCTNKCLMRQGPHVPAWIDITYDRLAHGPLCPQCTKDLKEYFFKPY